jgi:CHAD domain-containing protein
MFRLDLTEPVHHEIRRLALGELEDAEDALSGGEEPVAARIHEARKRLKRLRALLDLVQQSSDQRARRALIEASRKAADLIAVPRGHAALLHAYDALVEAHPECETVELGRALGERAAAVDEEAKDVLANAARILHEARACAKALDIRGRGFDVIGSGIRRTYRRARRALALARDEGGAAHFHEFRKPCTRHLYQLRLLESVWPAILQAQGAEVDRTGELAGEHHDLCLLRAEIPRIVTRDAGISIERFVARRERELERRILALGALCFAEKPSFLCARIAAYWARASRNATND